MPQVRTGPLVGVKIVEIAGIGALPFAGMVLADMGADVVIVQRPAARSNAGDIVIESDPTYRGRRSIVVDLKRPEGIDVVLSLIEKADAVIESFRPGVTERLGLGPDVCLARNPQLIYGRLTGWGQTGPLASAAGHDINYLAVSGTLSMIGRRGERPIAPLNLIGDMGGGGMALAYGVVCALIHARRTGVGQVVDAAMIDGAALLATTIHGARATGMATDDRGTNLLDTGAPFYETYECADGRYVAVGPLEPRFYEMFAERAGLDLEAWPEQYDQGTWPEAKKRMAELLRTRPRDEWAAIFDGTDACVTPVLSPQEAAAHPHNVERDLFVTVDGVMQPSPAPRFSVTPATPPGPPPVPGTSSDEVLREAGRSAEEIAHLRAEGVVA